MIAFITGASSGIGWASALKLAALGYDCILCGRREERLLQLKKEIESIGHKAEILVFDVASEVEVQQAWNSLAENWKNIDVLVNNAGGAHGLEPIHQGAVSDWMAMIDANLKGLLLVSKPIMEIMVQRGSGHIINITSIAGKEVYPNGNVYCAVKHAADALTRGMRADLYQHGIKVSSIAPGLVETEFSLVRFKGDEGRAKKVYEGLDALKAEDIADALGFMVSAPEHVVIADVVIFPKAQGSSQLVKRNA
jgi:NADP-dependent 3-hydroxy acid dehydrogenase YdfG